MFFIGMFIGAIIGYGIAVMVSLNDEKDVLINTRTVALILFVERLRKKATANAEDWQEPCLFLSDIDEVFEEMVGDAE